MTIASIVGRVRLNERVAPSWWLDDDAFPEQTWQRIAGGSGFGSSWQNGDTLADHDPGIGTQSRITAAWGSGVVSQVTNKFWLAANGGHLDYSGNEVYELDLTAEVPGWVMAVSPSTVRNTGSSVNGTGAYSDGTPRSCHHWNIPLCVGQTIWFPMMQGQYEGGEDTSVPFKLDMSALNPANYPIAATAAGWTSYARPWSFSGNLIQNQLTACYDPDGHRIYICSGGGSLTGSVGLMSFDPDDPEGSYQLHSGVAHNSPGSSGNWAVVLHDKSPKTLVLGDRRDGVLRLVNLDVLDGYVNGNQSGSPTGLAFGASAFYIPAFNAIIAWHHSYGTSLRKLTIPSNPISGTYTWSTITGSGGATPPGTLDSDFQGAFGKFNYIADMGDGRGAFVFVGKTNQPTFIFKIPAGGL